MSGLSSALSPLLSDAAVSASTWTGVALAALNVLQTIALAYLAVHKYKNGQH